MTKRKVQNKSTMEDTKHKKQKRPAGPTSVSNPAKNISTSTEPHSNYTLPYIPPLALPEEMATELRNEMYAQQDIAVNIAEVVACFLEAHLSPKSTLLETTAPPPKQVKGTRGAKQPSNTSSSARIAHIDEMRDWLLGKPLRLESGMYGPITAFVSYVALCVQAQRDKAGSTAGIRRLICPADKADYQPDDSDDKTRIDIGLCSMDFDDPAPTASTRTPYHKLLAVVEAKVRSGNFKEAWPQLYGYTRQMYQAQHNLSSAWGFAICGHEVRVCHFGNDVAVSSNPMNVTTPEGRRAFIELLVDWSMCEDSQLGHDPTIEYLPNLDCWQIDCPDDTAHDIDCYKSRF
ncbi:hypothetical protein GGI01_000190 [Coemansia sp. RSA 376]|nr:hypothetical protein GGI01_000190 [Coemansia sp. RSA 376]